MTSLPITLVCADTEVARYARFLAELRQYSGQDVPVLVGTLEVALDTDGFILLPFTGALQQALTDCLPAQRAGLAARLVPLGVGSIDPLDETTDIIAVAAAIDEPSLQRWQSGAPSAGAWGLYGRHDIGDIIGAGCFKPYSGSYCSLFSAVHLGLPHLLVDYLSALTQTMLNA